MTKFQIGILVVFGVFILVGVLLFSLGKSSSNSVSNISVWGYMPDYDFKMIEDNLGIFGDKTLKVTYRQVAEDNFDQQYVEALADGVAPDVVYINHDQILKQGNRITPIPYDIYPQRDFQNTFLVGTEVLLGANGSNAIPLTVDPLILYWNRDIFTENSVLNPPKTWATYTSDLIYRFTKKDGPISITQSALPFGTWDNLTDVKGILSMLILQGGGNVTDKGVSGVVSTLGSGGTSGILPAEAALSFFVDFSNPQKSFYTWNRSLPNSLDYFASGRSATYIGYASEIQTIKAKNPNLNFDVALVPQSAGTSKKVTYGKILSLAISSATKDLSGSLKLVYILASKDGSLEHSEMFGGAPARKDALLTLDNSDAYQSVVYNSASLAKTWLDPDKKKTDNIFADMINSVVSGRKRVIEAVDIGNREMSNLLQ